MIYTVLANYRPYTRKQPREPFLQSQSQAELRWNRFDYIILRPYSRKSASVSIAHIFQTKQLFIRPIRARAKNKKLLCYMQDLSIQSHDH